MTEGLQHGRAEDDWTDAGGRATHGAKAERSVIRQSRQTVDDGSASSTLHPKHFEAGTCSYCNGQGHDPFGWLDHCRQCFGTGKKP